MNGNIDNYKVTYDLDKVKAVLLKKGVDSLLEKEKNYNKS